MNAAAQWQTIGAMILSGLSMGTVFDVYRVAAHRFRLARWALPPLDLLYWALATLAVFSLLLRYNNGEVRLYVFLGLGIGVTAYFGLLSGTVMKLSKMLFAAFEKTFGFLFRLFRVLLLVPLFWIVRVLAKLLDIVFVVVAAILLGILRLLLKLLRPPGRWLWSKMLPIRRALAPVVRWWESVRGSWTVFKQKARAVRDLFRKKE